ncbi:MAG: hypothetical protein WB799_06770 [Candidatus Sulfotelmatobacter sp.]
MKVHLRFLVIAVMLPAIYSISASADDAKGWFEGDCTGATFQISKFAGASPGQYLVLRFDGASHLAIQLFEGEGWLKVQGKRCLSADQCEAASEAKIWLNPTKGAKRISGKYTVDFSGQHLEGQFLVKYRRHKGPAYICE